MAQNADVQAPRAERVHEQLLVGLTQLDSALIMLDRVATGGDTSDTVAVRTAFDSARFAYKRIEFTVNGLMPTVAKGLNGPPVAEMEDEESDRPVRPPGGLQVMEQLLLHATVPDSIRRVAMEARIARSYLARAVQVASSYRYTDATVLDLLRRELASVAILGLGHFDAIDRDRGFRECAVALGAVRKALTAYRADGMRSAPVAWASLDSALARAIAHTSEAATETKAETDSENAGPARRLALLVDDIRPAALALAGLRDALHVQVPISDDGWRASAPTPFELGAIDPASYAHASALSVTPARVELGHDLFFDKRLSRDETRSCDACHIPERAFSDGRATALLLVPRVRNSNRSDVTPPRNTPTLINSGVQPVQFSDGRVAFMEDQIASVIHNREEMDGDLAVAARRLSASAEDRAQFATAFGEAADSTVTPRRVQSAITAYLRTLTRLNAPFDRYVRGDRWAMSADAQRGYDVFMGKARCGTCHFAPTFGAAMPSRYLQVDYEVLGVPDATQRKLDDDIGRERVAGDSLHRRGFRTPVLRNVALTAPYMHNGTFRTLAQVITFYNNGGGQGMGFDVPNQTLPADSLHLTSTEQRQLIAFLGALTDTSATTQRPTLRTRALGAPTAGQRRASPAVLLGSGVFTPGTPGTRKR